MLDKKEWILCAAIYYPDDKAESIVHRPRNTPKGLVVCGHRHCTCINMYFDMTLKRTAIVAHVEGFLTSKNRFVDRKEAAKIAFDAGQVPELYEGLLSEHLY